MTRELNTTYAEFIRRKSQLPGGSGFDPLWMPSFLFPFQRHLVEWAIRRGRAAIWADCGMGKSAMELVWAENVVRRTSKPVLILTPLAVSHQMCREAEKFALSCERSADGRYKGKIVTTNYERLHFFNPDDFGGVVCDESSILKNCAGQTRARVTEFLRRMPYRLLCTATAAPNDFVELGTSSEAIGELGYSDMVTRFFKEGISKDYLGWGRKSYVFRGHAEQPFWRWVCSWARACRKPSDLGFSDDGFDLPPLIERERFVESSTPRDGLLFPMVATNFREEREERRVTLRERCEVAAAVVAEGSGPSVTWCHLNPEGDLLVKLIPGSVQVKGSMSDDEKEETLLAFQIGQIKDLVIKPKIGCLGLNWQHCNNVVDFASHSYEQRYQLIRRCWRFGQANPVTVTTVLTEGERSILANFRRKAVRADRMFESLVRHMVSAVSIDAGWEFTNKEKVPTWL